MSKYDFNTFFENRVIDNNGISVTDINTGLNSLFAKYVANEQNINEDQRYLVPENEENYSDLVAAHCIINDPKLWWWFLLTNRLDDPLKDVEANYTYSAVSQIQMENVIDDVWANGIETAENTESRIGKIIELN